jgi:hypothetical protein
LDILLNPSGEARDSSSVQKTTPGRPFAAAAIRSRKEAGIDPCKTSIKIPIRVI